MKKSILIAVAAMAIFVSPAKAGPGSLEMYDVAIPTSFAFMVKEASMYRPVEDPQTYVITSRLLLREFSFPADAQFYWVLQFGEGFEGGLVVASSETGEIYDGFGEVSSIFITDVLQGGELSSVPVGVITGDERKSKLLLNMALSFNIEDMQIMTVCRYLIQVSNLGEMQKWSVKTVSGMIGDGDINQEDLLLVLNGFLKAQGKVLTRKAEESALK